MYAELQNGQRIRQIDIQIQIPEKNFRWGDEITVTHINRLPVLLLMDTSIDVTHNTMTGIYREMSADSNKL